LETTAAKVLLALQAYDLKQQSGTEYRLNSPLRAGSNSHGFTLHVHTDGEHGTWFDHVSGEKGSLYQLAEKLGIQPSRLEQPVPTSKRGYSGLADYAAAHGITAAQLTGFFWQEAEYKGKLALRFKTKAGDRWRLLEGTPDELKAPYRNQPGKFKACWYGLNSAVSTCINSTEPLIIANGEISAVVGQVHGLAAVAVSGGEKEISDELITELKDFFGGKLPSVLIPADCDPTGRKFARINAQKLIAVGFPDVKALDLGLSKGGDLADLCRMYGKDIDEVLPMLPELRSEEMLPLREKKMVVYSREDLKHLPPVEWLIDGEIPKRGITVIYGASGEYKTYLALDFACNLSQENSVLYLAAEGQNGLDSRITAWETHHSQIAKPRFVLEGFDILNDEERDQFIHAIQPYKPTVIFIDTLGRTMWGDLNNSRDIQAYLRACEAMKGYLDGAIVLIHHKSKAGVEYGSVYIRNNVDLMLEVTKIDDVIKVDCTKSKYTQPSNPRFMKPVTVGDDVVLIAAENVIITEGDPLSRHQLKTLQVLAMEAFSSGASVQEIIEADKMPQSTLYQAISVLKTRGFIENRGESKYIITEKGRQYLADSNDSNRFHMESSEKQKKQLPLSPADSNENDWNRENSYYTGGY
jgi:DNA-binding PadR family transcriptional regulator